MRFDPQAGITNLSDQSLGRRRGGRIGQAFLQSNLGPVLDLSSSGMRVITRRLPRGTFKVVVSGFGKSLTVQARIAWSKRRGIFKREAGLEFIGVDSDLAVELTALGLDNRPL